MHQSQFHSPHCRMNLKKLKVTLFLPEEEEGAMQAVQQPQH